MNPEPSSPIPAALPPGSSLVIPEAEVDAALDRIAREVTADLADARPIAIAIMNGGLVFAGQLLTRLPFTLECDYIHVRRYGRMTVGGELEWISGPHVDMKGRTVLLRIGELDRLEVE